MSEWCTEHVLPVPPLAQRWADLPGFLRERNVRVYLNTDGFQASGDGLPRSLRDLLGRVIGAGWSADDEITIYVEWVKRGAEHARDLLDRELAQLSLVLTFNPEPVSAYLEVVPARTTPVNPA